MCRHVAYVGPGARLSSLFFEPPHSLEHQTYAARELLEGHVNVDGFGVSWYPLEAGDAASSVIGDPREPLAYRSERPVWADPTWKALASRFVGRIVVANVRNATDPATAGLAGVHPFTRGRWSFTHNGFLTGFRDHFLLPLEDRLSNERRVERQGFSDTQTLFLLLLDKLERGAGAKDALVELVQEVVTLANELDKPTYLNFLLSDGERVWGTRAGTAPRNPSLWVAHSPDRFPGGALIASEALDEDPAWQQVPPHSLVELRPGEPPALSRLER